MVENKICIVKLVIYFLNFRSPLQDETINRNVYRISRTQSLKLRVFYTFISSLGQNFRIYFLDKHVQFVKYNSI